MNEPEYPDDADEWNPPDPGGYYVPAPQPDARQAEIGTRPDDQPMRPTWAPVDLSAILSGDYRPPEPVYFLRADGVALLYPGLTHSFHGESESGKSLLVQIETARLLAAGKRVLYIDCESDPVSVVGRLVQFGAPTEALGSDRFLYVHPETDPRRTAEQPAWEALLSQTFALAVIDGVTAALGLLGAESKDNDQVTKWMYAIPDRLARRTGAATVLIDHVTKDAQTRGRYAIGGQAKLAAITGAAYVVEIDGRPIGDGKEGVVALRLSKDRPGYLRARCGPYRPSDRTQVAAHVVIDSTGDKPQVRVLAPTERSDEPAAFRPTVYMEKVSRFIEGEPGCSSSAIEKGVGGKSPARRAALAILVTEGYVLVQPGARNAQLHTSARPYRERDDPASKLYTPEPELPE